jgi:hypothetical protein
MTCLLPASPITGPPLTVAYCRRYSEVYRLLGLWLYDSLQFSAVEADLHKQFFGFGYYPRSSGTTCAGACNLTACASITHQLIIAWRYIQRASVGAGLGVYRTQP